MEAFGDESYVGIKEITMDMKVKLHQGDCDEHVMKEKTLCNFKTTEQHMFRFLEAY